MKFKFGLSILVVFFLVGCSTTRPPSDVSKMQIKVAQLERKLNEKDQQINDLKYEIKDLTMQLEEGGTYDYQDDLRDEYPDFEPIEEPVIKKKSKTISYNQYKKKKDDRVIRVSASAKQIQKALRNAGYYEGSIDGKIGSRSKKAIKEFQKDHDLTSDGIIGKKTWTELKTYLD